MRSIDSLLHIVVFTALFSSGSIFVDSACRNYPNPGRISTKIFYDPIEDPNSYLRLKARIGETIDIPLVCPKSIEREQRGSPDMAFIHQVDFEQFYNCENKSDISAYIPLARFECKGKMLLQKAKFAVKLVDYPPKQYEVEYEEGKVYYFISTSGPRLRHCDGFFILFSIKIEPRKRQNEERNFYDNED